MSDCPGKGSWSCAAPSISAPRELYNRTSNSESCKLWTLRSRQFHRPSKTSPGRRKFSRVERAIFWARPMPDSSMPPHQTGIFCDWQMSWIFFASVNPPTRPTLMLIMRHAPVSTAMAAARALTIDLSRQMAVRNSFWQAGVVENIVVPERLLDHQQVELIEGPQMLELIQCVGGVGIAAQRNVRPPRADFLQHSHIPARFHLHLNPPIASS